nr:hypothetical transcript [Hymenolepis microstoma]
MSNLFLRLFLNCSFLSTICLFLLTSRVLFSVCLWDTSSQERTEAVQLRVRIECKEDTANSQSNASPLFYLIRHVE